MAARAVSAGKPAPDVVQSLMSCPKAPTENIIAAVKQAARETGLGDRLYKFELEDQTVIFRPLYRYDYDQIQEFIQANKGTVSTEVLEQKFCEKAILWPQEILHPVHWERQRAGLQRTLSQQIQARSGFLDPTIDQSAYLRIEPLVTPEPGPKPDGEAIAQLKAQYPEWNLRLVGIEGDWYAIRPVSRGEWKQITAAEEQDMNLLTAERAVIWSRETPGKPEFANKVAGTVQTLAEAIMQLSGFLVEPVVEEL